MDIFFYTVIGTLIGTAAAMALVSEGGAFLDRLNRRIVRRVLAQFPEKLPETLRQRWSEEIEGDFETFSKQPLRGLWFALQLRQRGARGLAAELVLQLALSAPVLGGAPSGEGSPGGGTTPGDSEGWLTNGYAAELRKLLEYKDFEAQGERRLDE